MSHIHTGGGSQTGVICYLITFILARCFPTIGPWPVSASLPAIPAKELTPEEGHIYDACNACNAKDPTQAHKHTLEVSALPQSYIPTTGRQAVAHCMTSKATCSESWFLSRMQC